MADRSFGPTLLAGVAGSGLLALAGHRDWVRIDTDQRAEAAATMLWDSSPAIGQMPVAGALGLVALASWGVLLVTRGRVRRVVTVVGTLAGLGALLTWVQGWMTLRETVGDHVRAAALPGEWSLAWTAWFPVAAVAGVVAVVAGLVATVRVPRWPAMGSRYDAPRAAGATSGAAGGDLGEADPTDLWKAIDEGHDPTGDPAP